MFDKLEASARLEGEEPETLAVFILSLVHRTPSAYDALQSVSSEVLNEVRAELRQKYDELRGPNDPLTFEEYVAGEEPDADLKYFYQQFPKFVVNENLVRFLTEMHWAIFTRPEGVRPLLMSDDPLIRTDGWKKSDGHLAWQLYT